MSTCEDKFNFWSSNPNCFLLTVKGRSVYILWSPSTEKELHCIDTLQSGAFEVQCCHDSIDFATIERQISKLIEESEFKKKNQ